MKEQSIRKTDQVKSTSQDELIKTQKLIGDIEELIDRIKILRIRISLYLLLNTPKT
jgi:hypothetical protein